MKSPDTRLEELIRRIICSICLKTPDPQIRYSETEAKFYVRVNTSDQGRCVGKQGRNHWAINAIMWYAGLSLKRQPVVVKLEDPMGEGFRASIPFKANPRWDKAAMADLVELILSCVFGDAGHAWVIDETTPEAVVRIQLDRYLKNNCVDPDIVEALQKVIHAAGMASGALLNVEVTWK